MKRIIWLLIIVMLPFVMAEKCKEVLTPNQNCTMLTPSIVCSNFTYSIIKENGTIIINGGNLTQLNGSIYFFTFNESKGSYIIQLCDDSTREIVVKGEDNMIIGIIMLIPLILGIIFLVGSATLSEEHAALKIFLFLLSIITFFVSLHFGMIAIVEFFQVDALQNAIGSVVYWFGITFGVIVTYFIIYLFFKLVHAVAQKKEEKLRY